MFFPEERDYFPELRKVGFPRYREVLEGNLKAFFLVGFMAIAGMIPFAAGMVYAVLSRSLLIGLASGLVGGMIAGPGLACMHDLVLRRLRDDQADWWTAWKRSLRQNWRASLLPSAVEFLFLAVVVFEFALSEWGAAKLTLGTLLLFAAAAFAVVMVLQVWWPQAVLFEQRSFLRLKNALLFNLLHLGRGLLTAAIHILWWTLTVLFFPWSMFLVPFLSVWYILFLTDFLLYRHLDADFRIEEQIEEKREAERPKLDAPEKEEAK